MPQIPVRFRCFLSRRRRPAGTPAAIRFLIHWNSDGTVSILLIRVKKMHRAAGNLPYFTLDPALPALKPLNYPPVRENGKLHFLPLFYPVKEAVRRGPVKMDAGFQYRHIVRRSLRRRPQRHPLQHGKGRPHILHPLSALACHQRLYADRHIQYAHKSTSQSKDFSKTLSGTNRYFFCL